MEGVHGIVYLTSRVKNARVVKRYVGIHTIKGGKFDDGYLGSGKILLQAIAKHGRGAFTRETLEVCHSRAELLLAEKKWVAFFDAVASPDFYNLADGGQGGLSGNKKQVSAYSPMGVFIATWPSVADAAREIACAESLITGAASGRKKTAIGLQWAFGPKKTVGATTIGVTKKVVSFDPHTKEPIRTFDSLTQAAKSIGQNTTSNIVACCKGAKITAGGLCWAYFGKVPRFHLAERGEKAVVGFNSNTEVRFPSLAKAALAIGGNPSNIHRSIKTGGKHKGFRWRYA